MEQDCFPSNASKFYILPSYSLCTNSCQAACCHSRIGFAYLTVLNKLLKASLITFLRYKETTGKSVETLEKEKASKAMLENQNKAQVEFNCELQDEVAQLRAQLSMAQTNGERQAGKLVDSEGQRKELEAALEAATSKVREGEIIRRKLHNTILVKFRLSQTPFCLKSKLLFRYSETDIIIDDRHSIPHT